MFLYDYKPLLFMASNDRFGHNGLMFTKYTKYITKQMNFHAKINDYLTF